MIQHNQTDRVYGALAAAVAPDTHHVLQTQEWKGTFRIEFNNGFYSDDDNGLPANRAKVAVIGAVLLTCDDRLVDGHPCHWLTALFLFGCINKVRLSIHREAMHRVLDRKVF